MNEPTIYLEANDDLSDSLAKIARIKAASFVLVIPKGAVLLHSPLNLKLLKRYFDETNRTARIALAEPIGNTLAEQAGFELATITAPLSVENVSSDDLAATTPELSIEDDSEFNASLPSLPRGQGRFGASPLTGWLARSPQFTQWRLRLSRQHKIAFSLVLAGLVILLSVGYFILPHATVKLEVQSEPFKKQFALTLADEQDLQAAGAGLLTGRFLEVNRENISTFSATGEKNAGDKAEGKITVINYTGSIVGLLANTRFQTASGLIFRSKNEVLAPPVHGQTPGRATVDAVAGEGGTKYQLAPPTRLSIPGLGAAAQALVYGEIVAQFTSATDNITKVVSKADIDKAQEEAAKTVFVAAENELQKQLKHKEEIIPAFIQNDVIDAVPNVSADAATDQFEIRVQSRSWTIAIAKGALQQAIANAATFEVPEGKQLTQQTIDATKLETVEGNFLTHQVKLSASVDGRMGPRLDTADMVAHLVGQPVTAGKDYLQSLTSVASSSIELWPRFLPRLPLLENNIRLQVVYLGE